MKKNIFFLLILFIVSLYSEDIIIREEIFIKNPDFDLLNIKLNINSAPIDSLLLIPNIDIFIAEKIIRNRPYQNIKNALFLAGLSEYEIDEIKDFLYILSIPHFIDNITYKTYFFLRYQEYSEKNFQRQPFKIKNGNIIDYNQYQFSLSIEQDPGELIFPDLINTYISYKNNNTQIILGNQILKTGAGLLLGKEQFNLNLIPSSPFTIKGYSGSIELGIPTGLSLLHDFTLSNVGLYIGRRYYDAKFDSINNITNIYTTGNHSSELSYSRRRNFFINEFNIFISSPFKYISFIYNYSEFSNKYILFDSIPYKSQQGISTILNIKNNNNKFFLDISKISPGDFAFYTSIQTNYNNGKTVFSLRHLRNKFYSPLSNPTSEGNNEEGIYLKSKYKIFNTNFTTFANISREIETDSIIKNFKRELQINIERKFFSDLLFKILFKHSKQSGSSPGFPGFEPSRNKLSINIKTSLLNFSYYNMYANDKNFSENGEAISLRNNLQFNNLRITLFIASYYTPSYASRIYIYLPELPKTFTYLVASGTGSCFRIIGNYNFHSLTISAFYEFHREKNQIGLFFNAKF